MINYKLHSWQEKLLIDLETDGLKPGEMMITTAGRGMGKSYLNQLYGAIYNKNLGKYTIEAEAQVDGEQWYTVRIYASQVVQWLRSQDSSQYKHLESDYPMIILIDMHEQLYTMMVLKFS
jgi:hypothetical protein